MFMPVPFTLLACFLWVVHPFRKWRRIPETRTRMIWKGGVEVLRRPGSRSKPQMNILCHWIRSGAAQEAQPLSMMFVAHGGCRRAWIFGREKVHQKKPLFPQSTIQLPNLWALMSHQTVHHFVDLGLHQDQSRRKIFKNPKKVPSTE